MSQDNRFDILIKMLTSEQALFEMTPELRKCYITGKPNTKPYIFGNRIIIGLTEEAFAHFIIEAGKDSTHSSIIKEENVLREAITKAVFDSELLNLETFKGSKSEKPTTQDQILELQSRLVDLDVQFAVLLAKKGQSGLRILKNLKNQYVTSGKLP